MYFFSTEEGNRIELSPAHHRWNCFQGSVPTIGSTFRGPQRETRTPKSSGFEPVDCTNLSKPVADNLVPQTGFEPVRPCGLRFLRPMCLPIPPSGLSGGS